MRSKKRKRETPADQETVVETINKDKNDVKKQEQVAAFCLVQNIPKKLRIPDLRHFFTEWIEREKFEIFHYLYQQETYKDLSGKQRKGGCCLIKLKRKRDVKPFLKRYHEKPWRNRKGEHVDNSACIIQYVLDPTGKGSIQDPKGKVSGKLPVECLYAPVGLAAGNVGTSMRQVKESIDACILPTRALKTLGITANSFAAAASRSQTQFEYEWDPDDPHDDHDAEEWERYQAIHGGDLDEEKKYTFENPVELKWEKGGSGLVFYTDAVYWNAQKGDFVEQTSDDWMVSEYHIHHAKKPKYKPMVDDMGRASYKDMGGFERYTKGMGSKILKNYGWVAGKGLGPKSKGRTKPIIPTPKNNMHGLGYVKKSQQKEEDDQQRQMNVHGDFEVVPDEQSDYIRIRTVYDSN
mmetsp:Transcript_15992/g.17755  ORF Transcript_15992/g.17755 Transcript_15992/m.17755 type:complete len:407 (-) Transcript_15992:55-1275(-)